jgi:hypothetical protein
LSQNIEIVNALKQLLLEILWWKCGFLKDVGNASVQNTTLFIMLNQLILSFRQRVFVV